jgi:hypothetical protein
MLVKRRLKLIAAFLALRLSIAFIMVVCCRGRDTGTVDADVEDPKIPGNVKDTKPEEKERFHNPENK